MLKQKTHNFKKIMFVILLSFLLVSCAKREVYYFKSECPVSKSAKNLWVGTSGSYQLIGFYGIDDKAVAFQYGNPGGMPDKSHELDEYFVIEEIPISPYGILLQQGYYEIGSSILPAQIPLTVPAPGTPDRLYYPCPDAYGSEHIRIHIFENEKATKLAGLWWINSGIRIDILEDGSIEVSQAGIRAADDDGNWWVSDYVSGSIFMVKE